MILRTTSRVFVSITGVTEADIQTASGFSDFLPQVFIAGASSGITDVEIYSEDFYALLIGQGWPEIYDATASTTDTSNYNVDYWGTEDQVATAEIYVEKFDADTGLISIQSIWCYIATCRVNLIVNKCVRFLRRLTALFLHSFPYDPSF